MLRKEQSHGGVTPRRARERYKVRFPPNRTARRRECNEEVKSDSGTAAARARDANRVDPSACAAHFRKESAQERGSRTGTCRISKSGDNRYLHFLGPDSWIRSKYPKRRPVAALQESKAPRLGAVRQHQRDDKRLPPNGTRPDEPCRLDMRAIAPGGTHCAASPNFVADSSHVQPSGTDLCGHFISFRRRGSRLRLLEYREEGDALWRLRAKPPRLAR
jgi:hypothetical protein